VVDPVALYYHVLASLSQDAVRLVRHVLHQETSPESYANLRTSLLASHSLSNYQKMERMMKLPPLGDRKPSVMLAEMLEFCPAGESTTAIFTYLFLQRLPREIRVLLSEDDPADVRAIADKADRLIAMHVPQHHDACAAVAGGEDGLGSGRHCGGSSGSEAEEVQAAIRPTPPAAVAEGPGPGAGAASQPTGRAGRPEDVHVFLPRQVWRAASLL
jgi:hypothetical protein